MSLSRRTFLASSAAVTGILAAPTLLKAQPSEYVFAASLPMTGPFATAGQIVAPVFKMFEVLTNQSGGIGGVPIRSTIEDSGYIPQNALANYQRALATEENLVMYFGDSTGFMKLVAPELRGENARLMGGTSFATELSSPDNPYQFMAGPTYEDQFDILLQNMADDGASTVAFIFSNTEFGRDPIEHGKMKAEELGLRVVLEEATRPQGADIPTHVTKLAQSNADVAILQGYVTGVWPQLIGGARQFGLPTQFKGTFWGMENLIADRVTAEAGPILDGYQGVMPYQYFYDAENAPRYEAYAAFAKQAFAGTPLENYLPTWAIQGLCALEMGAQVMRNTLEADLPLTADNLAEGMANLSNWNSGGFFGGPVSVERNKVGTGRVYTYSAADTRFSPSSDWFTV
ncbi:MAG: ABC transporter substrate-binding protein [Pseudomonadota bacterium]